MIKTGSKAVPSIKYIFLKTISAPAARRGGPTEPNPTAVSRRHEDKSSSDWFMTQIHRP